MQNTDQTDQTTQPAVPVPSKSFTTAAWAGITWAGSTGGGGHFNTTHNHEKPQVRKSTAEGTGSNVEIVVA